MHSSTSSSNAAWRKSAWLTLGLFSVSLLTLELAGRRFGFVPRLDEYDFQHWADERSRLEDLGSRGVVLLGRSEMVRALSLEVWREELPGLEVVQLSLLGRQPGAAIQDVTREPGFSGVIVCAVADDSPFWAPDQQPWVDFYRESWNWNEQIDWAIKKRLALALVSYPNQFNPFFHARSLIRTGRWDPPRYGAFAGDRSHFIDWDLWAWNRVLPKRQAAFYRYLTWMSESPPIPGSLWARAALASTDEAVRDFQGRGGRFVFLRPPVADVFGEPSFAAALAAHKAREWDPFAAQTAAVAIHPSDEPELRDFRPRDGIHLDYQEAREFTKGFIDVLRRRGVL